MFNILDEDYITNQFASYDAIISDMGKDIQKLKKEIEKLNKQIRREK